MADVYDALSNKRCYKEAMDLDIVLSTMENDREKFDNEVYKAFLSLYK